MFCRMLAGLLLAGGLLTGCTTVSQVPAAGAAPAAARGEAVAPVRPPIVFVHGNGDSAAVWLTTLWRFESNGWPKDRLLAIDVPNPMARDDDRVPQPGRSSTAEQRAFLSAQVDAVMQRTGARQVVLVGSSRGGYAIRSYLRDGGGADKVSHVILAGTPNHGIWSRADHLPGSEFNGEGPFLSALNAPQGPQGLEITPGPNWLTLRSDANDKYAQPSGEWMGKPDWPTRVDANSPALRGAENRVLPGLDHRELAFHPRAFDAMWRFITGQPSAPLPVQPQPQIELNGKVTGLAGPVPTNLPLVGARVAVHAVDCGSGMRVGAPLLVRQVSADGQWGPLRTDSRTCLEFEFGAPGYATSHVYRSPFARSSDLVHLRPGNVSDADRNAGSLVVMTRPRGYFDLRRDRMSLNGGLVPAVSTGVAGLSSATIALAPGPSRSVVAEFNDEKIVMRTWPAAERRVSVAELHH